MGDTNEYTEAMVDIETLDTRDESVVYQVGIIIFKGKDLLYSKEYNLDVQEQLDAGRTVSEATLHFQITNPESLALSLDRLERVTGPELIKHLQTAAKFKPKYWWSKGDFDYDVLENLLGNQVPWQWYQKMELRTLIRETGADKPDPSHSALADCLLQLRQLNQCREIIDGATRSKGEDEALDNG